MKHFFSRLLVFLSLLFLHSEVISMPEYEIGIIHTGTELLVVEYEIVDPTLSYTYFVPAIYEEPALEIDTPPPIG